MWSQKDYPLIEVGTWTLNRNPRNFFAEIEQAALAPSNIVPGIGFSPDKMLLGRVFSYADAQRYRIGANHAQLPVNAARNEVRSYSKDGNMAYSFNDSATPVYAPNSFGGPHADPQQAGDDGRWEFGTEAVRAGYVPHAEDDDFAQAGTLVREVLDDAARARLVDNIVGHVLGGEPRSPCTSGSSSTGGTSTPTSARRSRRESGPVAPDRAPASEQAPPVDQDGENEDDHGFHRRPPCTVGDDTIIRPAGTDIHIDHVRVHRFAGNDPPAQHSEGVGK